MVLLGEIDEEREAAEKASKRLQEVSLEEILEAQSKQQAEKEEQEKLRQKIFKERGLTYTAEVAMDDNYWMEIQWSGFHYVPMFVRLKLWWL